MICFYIGQDTASGRILDDTFTANGPAMPSIFEGKDRWDHFVEMRAREWCQIYNLRYLDSDGPVTTFMRRYGGKQPKWAHAMPEGIAPENWRTRFTRAQQLLAYRDGRKDAQ